MPWNHKAACKLESTWELHALLSTLLYLTTLQLSSIIPVNTGSISHVWPVPA